MSGNLKIMILALAGLLALAACVPFPLYKDNDLPVAYLHDTQYGYASFYGQEFQGKQTANGERFDMYKLTAANRTLPFGTKVRVTNLQNGQQVVVIINDRGPFKKERMIDLSFAAAREIGLVGAGTAKVKMEVIELPKEPQKSK
jgi:rare lipoprotein A